jgi:hypothetical protein
MDWKELVASVVDSLAWPAAAIGVALVLRGQLKMLLGRKNETTLAHSWKIKFDESLAEARRNGELVGGGAQTAGLAPSAAAARFEPGRDSPVTTILLAYQELTDTLSGVKIKLGMAPDTAPQQILLRLVERARMRERCVELFEDLTGARNAAVHAGDTEPITDGEAKDFCAQQQILNSLLRTAIADL